jgi:aminoglycoside 6'-N-acetyltransferase
MTRLLGPRIILRSGVPPDVETLLGILAEPEVARWWGPPPPSAELAAELAGAQQSVALVIEVGGSIAGAIQYFEETDPMYRHATIDVYLATAYQDMGLGTEAVHLLARHLVDVLGHHRLTIDPAASNERAINCYRKVGFRPVGVMREYEAGLDGTFHDGVLMDLLARELQ